MKIIRAHLVFFANCFTPHNIRVAGETVSLFTRLHTLTVLSLSAPPLNMRPTSGRIPVAHTAAVCPCKHRLSFLPTHTFPVVSWLPDTRVPNLSRVRETTFSAILTA